MQKRRLALHIRMLQAELDRRKEKNPRYSLRGFAKLLNIHASSISRILAGKQELSLPACQLALEKLDLSPEEARLFIASVAEDRRNRAAAILTRALEPRYLGRGDIEPKFENIVPSDVQKPLAPRDVLALDVNYVSVMDLEGRFLQANEKLAHTLGTIPCDLIGDTWPSGFFDPELFSDQRRQFLEAEQELTFEFSVDDKFMRRTLTPILDARGKLTAFISTICDQTHEKIFEMASYQFHKSLVPAEIAANAVSALVPVFARSCAVQFDSRIKSFAVDDDAKKLRDLLHGKARASSKTLVASFEGGQIAFLGSRAYSEFDRIFAGRLAKSLGLAFQNAGI